MLSALMPAEPLDSEVNWLAFGRACERSGTGRMKSAILFVGDVFWMSCCVSTVSGVGAWKPSRMRVPVTRISPSRREPPASSRSLWSGGLRQAGSNRHGREACCWPVPS